MDPDPTLLDPKRIFKKTTFLLSEVRKYYYLQNILVKYFLNFFQNKDKDSDPWFDFMDPPGK